MSGKFEPPKFMEDASGYPEYKKKLLRWSRITKVQPQKQAEVVLYHLEGHPSGIQEKIDTALGADVEDKTDGLEKLIQFLDTIYAEDEMTEAWSKYKQFVSLKKEDNQPVTEFIAEFDKKHKKAKESGCEFSDIVLGFKLLESCNLSETDEKFVLTAVDFKVGKQNKNLLEQIKNSLRKFQSRERLTGNKDDRMQFKEEDSFVTSVKDALVADGWTPPSSSGSTGVKSVRQNSPVYKGKKNRLGTDGKPLRCYHCQSEFHLADVCDQKRNKKPKHTEDSGVTKDLSKDRKKGSALSKLLTKDRSEGVALSKVLAKASATDLSMVCQVFDAASMIDDQIGVETCSIMNDKNTELVLVSHDAQELCWLIEEAGCRGVIDTGCSKSVAGLDWVRNYTSLVSSTYADKLNVLPSTKIYQFGGGEKRNSQGTLTLPVIIGDIKIDITIEVVDAPIPLLIGSNSLESGEASLNFKDKTAIFFNQMISMIKIGAGHFCIELFSPHVETHINDIAVRDEFVQHALVTAQKVDIKMLKKLHHYYGHTSPNRLLKFLDNAGKDTEHLQKPLEKIEKSCEACIRTKNRKPRPKTAIPRVSIPHALVSLDLKEWTFSGKKYYICYMIDMFSRFTLGAFVKDKQPDTIVECIMNTWFRSFGQMYGLHSDIGGEFSNSTLEEIASKLGVELTTTAAYSPHQNGINERNHAIIDIMITRMMLSDPTLKPEMALVWSLNAKNSLENIDGFSPYQLQIGKNPLFPSTTRDGPPSYESDTKSKAFATHLNAMHSARNEFIKAESSASLKQALKSRVHPRGHDIAEGDSIYYKQKRNATSKDNVWQGPSKVVAVNGKKLFIDKGARLATVNRDDSVRCGEELWKYNESHDNEQKVKEGIARVLRSAHQEHITYPTYASTTDSEEDENDENRSNSSLSSQGNEEGGVSSTTDSEEDDDEENRLDSSLSLQGNEEGGVGEGEYEEGEFVSAEELDVSREGDVRSEEAEVSDNFQEIQVDPDEEQQPALIDHEHEDGERDESGQTVDSSVADDDIAIPPLHQDVKKDNIVQYIIPESDAMEVSKVISRAGKSDGPKRFWWNVRVLETGETKSVNMEAVSDLKIIDPSKSDVIPTLVVSIPRHLHNEPECIEAKEKELKNWEQFGVYEEVNDDGQPKINTNWVLIKKDSGIKARLCIRGDQEPNKNNIRTDSPTVNKVNIKLFFIMAVHFGWHVRTADIKAAFLQGADLDRDVFIRPPMERRRDGIIWKMVKRAYGFVDASRGFYLELKKVLEELGCKMSLHDPALFMYFGEYSVLQGLLLTHVDDLIHGAGTGEFNDHVLMPLKERFTFGNEEEDEFKYVGMHVKQVGSTIVTDQNFYVENLEIPYMESLNGADLDNLLDEDGQAEFRSAVGRIGWVANSSRPDLSYNNLILSMKVGNACVRDMKLAIKTIKRMKCENTVIKFVELGPIDKWVLEAYGDAGYQSLPDKISSCCGYVLLLSNIETRTSSVITWKSKKVRRVVGSSTAAEGLASNETLDALVYIKAVLKELLGGLVDNIPLVLNTDSKNLYNSVHTSSLVDNHRIRTDLAKLKESISNGELKDFLLVTGEKMIADVLTKRGAAGFQLMNILQTGKW